MLAKKAFALLIVGAAFLVAAPGCGNKNVAITNPTSTPAVELPTPDAKVTRSPDGGHFDLVNRGVFLATIPNADPADEKAVVLGYNRDSLYVGVVPHDVGQGYILFKTGYYYNVYQVARIGGQVQPLAHEGRTFMALSPDGQWSAWLEYGITNNLILKNLLNNTEKKFVLPNGYHQFGTMYFSPDSTKLAYAAAYGFPGRELGAVFVITMDKDSDIFIDKTGSSGTKYLVVTGWKNNDAPEYKEVEAGSGDASAK